MTAPKIAVIDYGIGNLRSAVKALENSGASVALTSDADVIAAADGVVLPGVGNFGACMRELRRAGLEDVARQAALDDRPFFGICVGLQMLFEGSEESPGIDGLGVIAGRVLRLPDTMKLPQIGWNTVEVRDGSQLFAGVGADAGTGTECAAGDPWVYFVHTYAAHADDPSVVGGWCEYGTRFVAAVELDTLWATQFHPEKSSSVGLKLLRNFVGACAGAVVAT